MFKRSGLALSMMAVLLLAGLSLPLEAQPAPKGAEQIAKTLSDWEARYKRLQSVRYVVSGNAERKDRPADSKLPALRPVKYVVLLDLVRGRTRLEINRSGPDANFEMYIPSVSICAYNGTRLQQNIDRNATELGSKSPDVCLTTGPLNLMTLDSNIWPVLFAHGVIPTVNKPPRPDQLPAQHAAEEFEYRGEVRHNGSTCILLRTDPVASIPYLVDEFWIDPTKESAIARYTYFNGTNPWYRFDITYQKSENQWLPNSWIFAHSIGNELFEVTHFTVDQLELNPAVTDADFTLPISPGSIVLTQNFPETGKGLDPFKPANGLFRVAANGKWITLEESGFTTAEGLQLPPESRSFMWVWIVTALIGVAVIATTVFLYLRRMRRLTSS
jgi:hypothetical protein